MEEVTQHILERMRAAYEKNALKGIDTVRAVLAGDPPEEILREFCAWDVNCGWCEEWVEEAKRRFGGEGLWCDQILQQDPIDCEVSHMVLLLNGLYYDSQTPQGARTIQEMDVFKGVSREEFLAREGQRTS